jgi:transposase-like protein
MPTALSKIRHLFYDGTYFHQDGCFISLMEAKKQKTIDHIYTLKEGYKHVWPWFERLKQGGLDPDVIIMDGERSVIRAIKSVWPKTKIQRCLYHIQREGMRWLRSHPRTEAGYELRKLLSSLCKTRTVKERDAFINGFQAWLRKYRQFVNDLPRTTVAFKDLKRTIVLIENALPDMFHYLDNKSITATTNTLEGFYSRLKADYRRHRGLSQKNKIQYLKWYCYYKNTNIF